MRITTFAAAAIALVAAGTQAQAPTKQTPPLDRSILHVQVILDRLGFGPGVLDGRGGQSLVAALKGFQESRGLPTTGKADKRTLGALYQYRAQRPVAAVTLTREILMGPYINPLPKDYALQAKLPTIGYRTPMEKLGEMFHTTPAVLIALNSPSTRLKVGNKIVVPNALPTSRDYDPKLRGDWRQTLAMLNVDANQPTADHVVVDKSDSVLRVLDKDNKLIAQFSATMGSEKDPLPLGNWKINGA
ncbi:MAG TPA: L,D-transpeptidase family protein, partial [Sphingomonas sp.]|nr:L,D-transpeptidase family protein [Sphingomonas sp.]